jgi:hypothetical protein
VLLFAAGCHGKATAPATLLDGSPVEAPAVALEDVSGAVILTTLRVVSAGAMRSGSPAARCLGGPARGARQVGRIVERTGVDSQTITVRDPLGVTACDATRAGGRGWCGSSFGRLYGGRLRDPRLDIGGCTTRTRVPVAFAWVEPDPKAKYVVVAEEGFTEVYEPAAGLPIRLSTRDLSADAVGASFAVTEHDAGGRLLRRFELDAVPAG